MPPADIQTADAKQENEQAQTHLNSESRALDLAVELKDTTSAASYRRLHRSLPGIRRLIKEATTRFKAAGQKEMHISYAAEWLLDNHYLALQAIRQVEINLPAHYINELPVLCSTTHKGYPRIYSLAVEVVLASRMNLDTESIASFLSSFQSITPLTMGELWAFPSMLRLVVLQSIAASAAQLTSIPVSANTIELPELIWEGDISQEEVIAGGITSLRMISTENWNNFFEETSLVERTLVNDPAGVYRLMDFDTRDRYRKAIESISLRKGEEELRIAQAAVQLAVDATRLHLDEATLDNSKYFGSDAKGHVGYYITGNGRKQLELSTEYTPSRRKRLERWTRHHTGFLYFGSIGLLASIPVIIFVLAAFLYDIPKWQMILGTFLLLTPSTAGAVAFVNWLITHFVEPWVLPKMDYSEGLPDGLEALIVIPALIDDKQDIDSLAEQLELHYLRNPDPNLTFVLLTDFTDAPQKHMPADESLLEHMHNIMQTLNKNYSRKKGDKQDNRFLYYHRQRTWNPSEGVWMGWERKRGKLQQLNRLIEETRTSEIKPQEANDPSLESNLGIIQRVCCVITLDEDTILPPGSAQRLLGTMTHPLNRAVIDEHGHVIAGYTVLQPRTRVSPTSALRTPFTRIYSGETGLDLYTLAVSDVYQDLFGEGIFTGKGIYNVQAFDVSLNEMIPDNSLLSHDLFEGLLGRAALVSDIVLIEQYPSSYLGHIRRLERWIRGDWQLLPWLISRRGAGKRLGMVDRWKIFDNLRRSLLSPGLFLLLICAWSGLLTGPVGIWTGAALIGLASPIITGLIEHGQRSGMKLILYIGKNLPRTLMALIYMPFETIVALGAIGRTLWRLLITKKNLLTWKSSAHVEKQFTQDTDRRSVYWEMRVNPVVSIILAAIIYLVNPSALPIAIPFLFMWLIGPEIAYQISLRRSETPNRLNFTDIGKLRRLARSTWMFFEQFVSPVEHWLPPDHFQESPLGTIAHRTSPTNIGMSLMASLVAHDLGYIGKLALAARLRSSFDTLYELERHRGHFLNWYDTRSLEPLNPRYVSTVDSGNLAACFITLRQGLFEMSHSQVLRREAFEGILDTLALYGDLLSEIEAEPVQESSLDLQKYIEDCQQKIEDHLTQESEWVKIFEDMTGGTGGSEGMIAEIDRRLLELVETCGSEMGQAVLSRLRQYSSALRAHVDSAAREIHVLVPWVRLLKKVHPHIHKQNENAEHWRRLYDSLLIRPTLFELDHFTREARGKISELRKIIQTGSIPSDSELALCDELDSSLESGMMAGKTLLIGFHEMANEAEAFSNAMDFRFLFDTERQVFHIGYNLSPNRLDPNYYDLLASEARIASLIAIARGEVPTSHWLHLSRPVTYIGGTPILLSWSATMFEYLMPALFTRIYEGTLLTKSMQGATEYQIEYGRQMGIPWGISESGYYRFDPAMSYQYQAFGIPGLGYKRGLAEELVVAPYASILALRWAPEAVISNLDDFNRIGASGQYGMYEAVDFTPERMSLGNRYQVVKEYMAHHQGMILLSLANILQENIIVRRFHADLQIQSVELLLQEQIPPRENVEAPRVEETNNVRLQPQQVIMTPWRARVNASHPRVHYLSNGRLSTLITAAGGGFSTWNGTDLTRWRSDTTLGDWGSWIYIQNLDSGKTWSVGLLPTGVEPDSRDVYFNAHMASFLRQDGDIGINMDIAISPDDDLEVRLISLTNHGSHPCHLRVTSYGEVILAEQTLDRRHPAFNKLFIESEYVMEENTLLFKRRPRSMKEETFVLGHALVTGPDQVTSHYFESDRMRFLGRLRTPRNPKALTEPVWQQGTAGATLDPIFSLGQELIIEPHSTSRLAYLTAAAKSKELTLGLIARHQSWGAIERVFGKARNQAEIELRQLGLDTVQLPRIQHLLSGLLFPHHFLRPHVSILEENRKGQSGLWAYGISGDYPILLVRMHGVDDIALAQELVQAHVYWRARGLMIDLVLLNEQGADYGQELSNTLFRMLQRSGSEAWINRRGGIFMIYADRLAPGDRPLLESAARVVVDGKRGSLAENLTQSDSLPSRLPAFNPSILPTDEIEATPDLVRPPDLQFDNGVGGFSPDGREYLIFLKPGIATPAPWVNVIGYPQFGFIAHETGLGSTWAVNSGENRLTPWHNDPVSDPPAEAIYLRDEETGVIWSPTPLPSGDGLPYLVRHGAGYTVYEHYSQGLKQQLRVFASPDHPVKIIGLRLENIWKRVRRITATYFSEWVLGLFHEDTQQFIIPEFDSETQALLARNSYNAEFGERIAFAAASQKLHGLTTDRTEFLGRMGDRAKPAALMRIGLAGTVHAGLDPCAALQLHLDLQPGESQEVYFLLGEDENREDALALVRKFQEPSQMESTWNNVQQFWDHILDSVQVTTPDSAANLLLNRWLLYQSLSCRFWGRSAFYQPSGAYGFRDQLQDVMALIHTRPDLTREHILRAAAHQFEMGDVLHWWHPPTGRGIRSRYSDDLLWLPYVTAHYVLSSGDDDILLEKVPFVQGESLEPGENERYGQYLPSTQAQSLLEHCHRAIERGSTAGAHRLPLMGIGDWNDGMNRVGEGGQGESVWLAWFLIDVLEKFAGICESKGDLDHARIYRARAEDYRKALEEQAWDGKWYLRAFYDDGTSLGSSQNRECKIDSIAQSWGVLSDAGDPDRIRLAMSAVHEWLVKPDKRLVLLFAPPFDRTPRDPGYIKGYLPGIRENGGQYTHAAIWTAWAYAKLGDGATAGHLFDLLNPILHAHDPESVEQYKVEPYVIAADVYGAAPHTGRGGWTWYTGSAAWMYRFGLEAILGFEKRGDRLSLSPCIRPDWKEYSISYTYGSSKYIIHVRNPDGLTRGKILFSANDSELENGCILLRDNGVSHVIHAQIIESREDS